MARKDESQLNAHIPKDLHKTLKRAALDREESIKKILIKALAKEVNWKPKKRGK